MSNKQLVNYDDGAWYASTLGHLISIMVDSGDPAVCFRVATDSEPDEDGKFIRSFEVLLLPDGYVADGILGCRGVHKTLSAFLRAGIVE